MNIFSARSHELTVIPIANSYWIATLGLDSNNYYNDGNVSVNFGPDGSVFYTGSYQDNSTYNVYGVAAKYDLDGNLLWQQYYTDLYTGNNLWIYCSSVDSNGNLYFFDAYSSAVAAKIDGLTGNIIWQKNYYSDPGHTLPANYFCLCLNLDASNNVYIASYNTNSYVKLSSADGTMLYVRKFTPALNYGCLFICADSSYNIFVGSGINSGIPYPDPHNGTQTSIFKFDSAGTQIFAKGYEFTIGGTATTDGFIVGINILPDNKFYSLSEIAYTHPISFKGTCVCKHDASGNVIWARFFYDLYAQASTIDSLGNVYIATENYFHSPFSSFVVMKFDPNGNLLWQNELSYTFGDVYPNTTYQIQPTQVINWANGKLVINFNVYDYTNNTSPFGVAQLPDDGSLIGTYSNFIYSPSVYSVVTPDSIYTADYVTAPDVAPSLYDDAGTLASGVSTFPSVTIPIP